SRDSRLPLREQEAEALVRVLRGPEARELAHRPQPSAVHARVDAARVRELARDPDALAVGRRVLRRVERLDLHVGHGREANGPLLVLAITGEPGGLATRG